MPRSKGTGWGEGLDRVASGGIARSTEARLEGLRAWGGFTSFMSASALAVGADVNIAPIGQVIGFSGGVLQPGVLRTTEPGQGRPVYGKPRWRERSGPIKSWSAIRRRALGRLEEQARRLGANAVVGIRPRRSEGAGDEGIFIEVEFTGTAVRVEGWHRARDAAPVLTLASAQELWALARAGIEPAGVAGSFARVETTLSTSSLALTRPWPSGAPSAELPDLTKAAYEARRLALQRLRLDAESLGGRGLIGIDLHQEHGQGQQRRIVEITVHLLATVLGRRGDSGLGPEPVVRLSEDAR